MGVQELSPRPDWCLALYAHCEMHEELPKRHQRNAHSSLMHSPEICPLATMPELQSQQDELSAAASGRPSSRPTAIHRLLRSLSSCHLATRQPHEPSADGWKSAAPAEGGQSGEEEMQSAG